MINLDLLPNTDWVVFKRGERVFFNAGDIMNLEGKIVSWWRFWGKFEIKGSNGGTYLREPSELTKSPEEG